MNFNTKYVPIITKFILLFCIGFFLLGAISSCKKNNDAAEVTLSFETNGGTTISPQIVKKGEKITPPTSPIKDGFVFQGWFADKGLSIPFSFDGAITTDMTIYAQWTKSTIEFSDIIRLKKIPANLDDELSKNVFSRYPIGAELIVKHLSPTGTGDGSSWGKAQGDLKKVLEDITDAYSNKIYLILLAKGEYKAGAEISMKNNVAIVGGFTAKDNEDYAQNATETTTLSGENSYRVFNNSGIDNSALLYGVKITAGKTNDYGGGMYNNSSSPILTYVTFSGNSATGSGYGGGMSNTSSSPILTYVTFSGNSASYSGGGMSNNSSSPILIYVTFSGNSVKGYGGGGMSNDNSSPILTHVTFSGNSATDGASGGAMYNESSSPILSYVTLAGNTTKSYGGGIYNTGSTILLITNSILWGNTNGSGSTNNIGNSNGNVSLYISLYNSVLQGGKNNITGTGTTYYDGSSMVDTDPGLGTLTGNGGFVQTMLIPSNSSARNIGLYAKRSGSGTNIVYFSKDKATWFTIDAPTGATTTATLPAGAIDLSNTDARGYKITDRPDAGAYEYGATAP